MKLIKNITIFCLLPLVAMSCGSLKQKKSGRIEVVTDPITEEQKKDNESVTNQKQRVKGEWTILSADGKDITSTSERAYINFSAEEGKIYGHTGCNVINGSFSIEANNKIHFTDLITTMMYCEEINQERNILNGLNNADSFVIFKQNGLYYLDIKNKSGATVLHAKRHNADVLSGAWQVASIHKQQVSTEEMQLVIDIPELKLHGNAGCNIINGSIGLDRNKDWFIQFQGIASTRKLCDEKTMKAEHNLLVALEEVEFIKRINNNEMKLTDKNGNEVLFLKRIDLKADR